ncbi:hypothetical protein CesoFtcFv8_001694 [Champsocephalus esox]|uniref:Uncharacterized protein n=1 Tax=Champsocephalus esox TaxID=159716 RepID=A0AAN8D6F2_9TELE|nr:hypothetical protein CesoFtcFv8_001694 [Champsocephalus esox]
MHEAIGGRPSIDPSTLMDSATAGVASGSGSTSTEAVQSQATVDEEAAKSGPDSQEDVEPSTSAGPPPRKKNPAVPGGGGGQRGGLLQPPAGSQRGKLQKIPRLI